MKPPPPSLSAALSNLTSHLQLSDSVLRSLPTATTTSTTSAFLPCPFNPNHRLPPSSLFSHYLNCPSPLSLPHNFHYPLTLHSSTTTSVSLPSLSTDSSDVCISLEDYSGYSAPANSFFYQNCPGPVTPSIQPSPLLNLPRALYVECADFNNDCTRGKAMGFSVDSIRFLPSEIWAIQTEIEAWGGGFPAAYSSRILRAILRLRDCKLLHLYEWIISSSPRYGIILDPAMRDHVILLVRLCLKVIVREAFEFVGTKFSDGESKTEDNDVLSGLSNRSLECPVLVKVMMWLALQFSILFGEANGKFFAIDVFKECILHSAMAASLFPLEHEIAEKVDAGSMKGETVANSSIFISQVAAGVAALRERSLIEGKIRALRDSRPCPAYQRNMEHAYVSKIADEERMKRPDYRPIIEYDGFLWQRSSNQDSNRVKTREELLAEERDYKRRRMSYRGKKSKRNTLEVMRDIIEEYMEDIKQAGGVGGISKDVTLGSGNLNKNVSGPRRSSEIPEENSGVSHDYRKQLDSFGDDIQQSKRDSSVDHGRQYHERNFKERIRYDDRGDNSGRKNSSNSREEMHGRAEHDHVKGEASHVSKIILNKIEMNMKDRGKGEASHVSEIILKEEMSMKKVVVKETDIKMIGMIGTEGDAVLVEREMKIIGKGRQTGIVDLVLNYLSLRIDIIRKSLLIFMRRTSNLCSGLRTNWNWVNQLLHVIFPSRASSHEGVCNLSPSVSSYVSLSKSTSFVLFPILIMCFIGKLMYSLIFTLHATSCFIPTHLSRCSDVAKL